MAGVESGITANTSGKKNMIWEIKNFGVVTGGFYVNVYSCGVWRGNLVMRRVFCKVSFSDGYAKRLLTKLQQKLQKFDELSPEVLAEKV